MTDIISDVYVKNAERHDPALGDDAMTFGLTVSRNISNRAVQGIRPLPDVNARLVDTALEVLCDGYVLRHYKLPGASRMVSVDSISWDDSEAKLDGAIENSSACQLRLDRDLDDGPSAFRNVTPPMRHLRMAHAGDLETGECVIYLGIPQDNRDGGRPWYDVITIHGDLERPDEGLGGAGAPYDPMDPKGPTYDELPVPAVELGRRLVRREAREPGSGE